ncbi:type I restriction endonuclease subunit R [Mycoplasma sp. Ms02]|uniref:type I restriction endonuclease subunit R n=1 Tax=Mycoplasma sp. Ms02 TaxID=353851 RepID=UPI001C8A74F2|nr:HsdR family type I site-specific deoxyribonuclease [Mycoplasma sp. Ms02]QZE12647.1 HsdR family type I site-specific deoxyribonuclease [Mycoplasma sp. Ms02]
MNEYNIEEQVDKKETDFEKDVIRYLENLSGTEQWKYEPDIKTTEDLWQNFRRIVDQNNIGRIGRNLSDDEFKRVKDNITNIKTPYEAGKFLFGTNGFSEMDIELDDGTRQVIRIFDQEENGAGKTVYQVVNQIAREKKGNYKARRFDITLLINGLPIIQIELKNGHGRCKEGLIQMMNYIRERQYSDIYSTLQVLVSMTPTEIKYMANSTFDQFNMKFAFHWQRENGDRVTNWKEFCREVLTIPMAHDLATRYMILEWTKNKQSIKVMRPYQVYATQKVLEKVRKHKFNEKDARLGYVWHTTGSGKTITSFKTAWLASRSSNVDKVVFLVDRIALTNQTSNAYRAYDLTKTESNPDSGVVSDTQNTSDLERKLLGKGDKKIIVTSIQKMSKLVTNTKKEFKPNILFIVDEAHRSTNANQNSESEGMISNIKAKLPFAAWVGYTGTPIPKKTKETFGDLLHSYTITNAIRDKNVLALRVEFKNTIVVNENEISSEAYNEEVASIYDHSPEHLNLVVQDVLKSWQKRSVNRNFNALFTVSVGGGKPSIPRALEYYKKFQEENLKVYPDNPLKIAIIFSEDKSNSEKSIENNAGLEEAIKEYNKTFATNFDMTTVKEYTEDVSSRLNKTADDRNYLDLVIVVNQLLTGFDAQSLNTLYVDRSLRSHSLIQAYSRTNRVFNENKTHGLVINYRFPKENEKHMNKAIYLYGTKDAMDAKESKLEDYEEYKKVNIISGILAKPFEDNVKECKEVIARIQQITNDFSYTPDGEDNKHILSELLKEYNYLIRVLKQQEAENPESEFGEDYLLNQLGIKKEDEQKLGNIAKELKQEMSKRLDVGIFHNEFKLVHINAVDINYDYIQKLFARLANQVYYQKDEEAQKTYELLNKEIDNLENETEAERYRNFAENIYSGDHKFDNYPVKENDSEIFEKELDRNMQNRKIKMIRDFKEKFAVIDKSENWILNFITENHEVGQKNLDKRNVLTEVMLAAGKIYKTSSIDEEIKNMPFPTFWKNFKLGFYEMADKIVAI